MSARPISIDLFSGAGGLSLGFEQAGFDVAAAIEVDPIHAAVHKYNFPECAVIPRSIREISGEEIRRAAGVGSREIEVVYGGPPCQGFSLIGQRMLSDPRNSLVREFLRIVCELSPSYFLFENVKGLTIGKHRGFLQELVSTFEEHDYRVRLPWKVLNASQFGVPQNRERLFLIGARKGRSIPQYPTPLTQPPAVTGNLGLFPTTPTCREALADLPDAEEFAALNDGDEVYCDAWGDPSDYANTLRCMDDGAWFYGYRREWNPRLLTASARTDHTDISRRRFSRTAPGQVEPISRFFKLSPDGICNTLRAGTDSARGAFTSPRPIHYEKNRCITVREMARLHGFPDWFRFHRTKWHGARQIGNAVPPPLARALAEQVLAAGGIEPTRPTRTIRFGNDELLAMDMTAAAAYWGVDTPIARRDRKSAFTKRKQAEIEAEGATELASGRHG